MNRITIWELQKLLSIWTSQNDINTLIYTMIEIKKKYMGYKNYSPHEMC